MMESGDSKVENNGNTIEQRSNDIGHDTNDNNNDDGSVASSSSSSSVIEVLTTLEIVQTLKRIPFLKRNLVSIRQRQVLSQQHCSTTNSVSIDSVSRREQASSSASLPFATLPNQTNSSRDDEAGQQQRQQQQQQQQSVSSKSSKKKRSSASSPKPQPPFVAPPLHHEYDDDQASSCQAIRFTKIYNVVDDQHEGPYNNNANADQQQHQPMFVEESSLLILNDDDDSQQDLTNTCPFCSHKLPTSIEAIIKHCRRFHGDHHEVTTKVLANRNTQQQQTEGSNLQKKQPNELEEGMIHIIAKPIGCRKINLDNAQVRSFYTVPRRRWWRSQNSIPNKLVEEKEEVMEKQQQHGQLVKKRKLGHSSANDHHHSMTQTPCDTNDDEDDDNATLELRRYRHQEAINHHKNQQQQQRVLLQQLRQQQRFKPHIPKKLLEEGRSSSSGSSSTTSSSSTSSTFIPHRQYYHSMSRIPMGRYDWEVDSDDLSEGEWRNELDAALMSAYVDVSDEEKEFLNLWNRFIRRDTVLSDFEIPTLCLKFIRCNATTKLRHLRQQLLMHLMALWEYQQVSSEHIGDLMNEYDSLIEGKKLNSDSDRKMPSGRSTNGRSGRKLPPSSIPSTTSGLPEPGNGNRANTTSKTSAAPAATSSGTSNKFSSHAAAVAAAAAAVTALAAAAAATEKKNKAVAVARTSSSQQYKSEAVVTKVSLQGGAGEQQAVTSVAHSGASTTTAGAMTSQQGLPTEEVAPPTASKPGAATLGTSSQRAEPAAVAAAAATVMHSASRSAATTGGHEQQGEPPVVTESTTGSPTPTTACNGSMNGVTHPVVAPFELQYSNSINGKKIDIESPMDAEYETIKAPLDEPLCPQHILNYIASAAFPREIVGVEPCKSAQQQVWIVSLSSCPSLNGVIKTVNDEGNNNSISLEWKQALQRGRNKVVVRLWKAGARWWNLHQNDAQSNDDPTLSLAQSEVAGYRIARLAFTRNGDGDQLGPTTNSAYIPRVLEYCESGTKDSETEHGVTVSRYCWAIIEYVGPHSALFCHGDVETVANDVCCHYDDSFVTGMVKTRSEFGFDEPHPRWGRVPVEFALDYALMILRDVMIPLHCQTSILLLDQQHLGGKGYDRWDHKPDQKAPKFQDMVKLYKYSLQRRIRPVWISKYQHQGKQGRDEERNEKMESIINHLEQALNDMETYTSNTHRVCGISSNGTSNTRLSHNKNPIPWTIPPLDPVLVHMDLQPQNILLARRRKHNDNICCNMQSESVLSTGDMVVQSVLDWEDSATADPRFDLLMVCRKVCANREQADILWKEYQKMRMASVDTSDSQVLELGPIEPWLQLETAHSLITLLLQSMDLLGGGRNPWETKKDLWGKLEREFNRLKQHSFPPIQLGSPAMTTQVEMGSPRNGENLNGPSSTIASESHSR